MANIYKISESSSPAGHLIFVHGLGGHPLETWGSNSPDSITFWPRWVAEDRKDLSVWTLGYQAPHTDWVGKSLDLNGRALTILERLRSEKELNGKSIIFVCHSLGGLLVKQMLRICKERSDNGDPFYSSFVEQVKGIAFFATPHSGARISTWASWLRFVANSSQATLDMTRNNPMLDNLNTWFRNWIERPKVIVGYETIGLSVLGPIVDKPDGDPGLAGVDAIAIERDHIKIVKPANSDDLVYVLTMRLIEEVFGENDKPVAKSNLNKDINVEKPQPVPMLPRIFRGIAIAAVLLTIGIGLTGIAKYFDWLSPPVELSIGVVRVVDLRAVTGDDNESLRASPTAITIPFSALNEGQTESVVTIDDTRLYATFQSSHYSLNWWYFVELLPGAGGTWISSDKVVSASPIDLISGSRMNEEILHLSDPPLAWGTVLDAFMSPDETINIRIDTNYESGRYTHTQDCLIEARQYGYAVAKFYEENGRWPARITAMCKDI